MIKSLADCLDEIRATSRAGCYKSQTSALWLTEKALALYPDSAELREEESWFYENLSEIACGC